jgi:hypothetical protein
MFSLIVTLAFSASTFARIDETEAQIEARYGKPIHAVNDNDGVVKSLAYLSGGFAIVVKFEEGISRAEMFVKSDHSDFSETEISILLGANKDGFNWLGHPDNVEPDRQVWCSTDKRSRVAHYIKSSRQLFITSQQFLEREAARKTARDKQKLKDF